MLWRPDRSRTGPDPFLRLKVLLYAIGAAAGFGGMIMDNAWLVGLGILVLLAAFVLRFLHRPRD